MKKITYSLVFIVFISCMRPDVTYYKHQSCYLASECMYYHRGCSDTKVCSKYIDACIEDLKKDDATEH